MRRSVLRKSGEPVRVLRLAQPTGPAMLTRVGANEARMTSCWCSQPYRRIEAQYLPGLVERVHQGADAAFAAPSGAARPLSNRARRWLFHSLARPVTRNRFHDLGCGVAALRRDALLDTPIYGDFFRFLPTLMQREGFEVVELPAQQHPGDVGLRFYGPAAYLPRGGGPARELLPGSVYRAPAPVLRLDRTGAGRHRDNPARNSAGATNRRRGHRQPACAAARHAFFLALGIQSIALGLVAEIIVHLSAPTRRPYRLARSGFPPTATIPPDEWIRRRIATDSRSTFCPPAGCRGLSARAHPEPDGTPDDRTRIGSRHSGRCTRCRPVCCSPASRLRPCGGR